MNRPRLLLLGLCLAASVVAAVVSVRLAKHVDDSPALVTAAPIAAPAPRTIQKPTGYSNMFPDDYVGPEACKECNAKNFSLWSAHPHRRMTQRPSAETVRGDFSGQHVKYDGGEA